MNIESTSPFHYFCRSTNTMILSPVSTSLAGENLFTLRPGFHGVSICVLYLLFVILVLVLKSISLTFRWKGESLRESIKRHEHFLALQLELKPGYKVRFRFLLLRFYCSKWVFLTCWAIIYLNT